MQALADRVLGLSAHLDDDGTVPVVFFSTDADAVTEIALANHQGRVERIVAGLGHMGKTSYHLAMDAVIDHYLDSGAHHPALVVFQTDGGPINRLAAERYLCKAAPLPLFWQFVGFGDGQPPVRVPAQARRTGGAGQTCRRQRRVLPRGPRPEEGDRRRAATTNWWASSLAAGGRTRAGHRTACLRQGRRLSGSARIPAPHPPDTSTIPGARSPAEPPPPPPWPRHFRTRDSASTSLDVHHRTQPHTRLLRVHVGLAPRGGHGPAAGLVAHRRLVVRVELDAVDAVCARPGRVHDQPLEASSSAPVSTEYEAWQR